MPRLRKLLLLLLVFVPLSFCGYKAGFYGFQLYLNRTPAQITDLPVYPGARDVRYVACTDPSLANCSTLTYTVNASEAVIHAFYEDHLHGDSLLPKRTWHGDGTVYPEYKIVNQYHKGGGRFQRLTLSTQHRSTGVEVTVVLRDK